MFKLFKNRSKKSADIDSLDDQGLLFETLEPRVLLSADLAGVLAQAEVAEEAAAFTAAEEQVIENNQQDDNSESLLELAFIDNNVENYQQLINDLQQTNSSIHIFILDSQKDGLEQIQQAVDSYRNIDAVHFITHGTDGEIKLGNTSLHTENLNSFESRLIKLGEHLGETSDLLFYGCDVASSDEGRTLLDQISSWTKADVAASNDLTGHSILGGDWELEQVVGDVSTNIIISKHTQASWQGTLDISSSLVAHYEFEENGGSTATDTTTNNNDGTWTNAPSWDSDSAIGGYSLDFTGDAINANEVISVPNDVSLDFSSDFSVAFWYNSSVSQDNSTRIIGSHDGSDGFSIFADNDGSLNFFVEDSSNIYSQSETGGFIADGNWHHVVATVTSGTLRLYIDSASSGSSGGTLGIANPSTPLTIGGESTTISDYEGKLDDVRVYVRALSASDVTELYSYTGAPSPQTYTVTNTNDAGAGSLRQAIIDANANVGADTIEFDIAGSGTQVIALSSALDTITEEVTIDGTTQTGWVEGSFLPIVIDG
ncbi:MAG: DUF4347 domain-containing protein, partial [Gammaproteobacteria bacterium]